MVAVMVAVPVLAVVTVPVVETDAMVASELDQPTARPLSGLPLLSVAFAVSCTVEPEASVDVAGATVTPAIEAAATCTTAVSTAREEAAA
jgi:hypothetical protein